MTEQEYTEQCRAVYAAYSDAVEPHCRAFDAGLEQAKATLQLFEDALNAAQTAYNDAQIAYEAAIAANQQKFDQAVELYYTNFQAALKVLKRQHNITD